MTLYSLFEPAAYLIVIILLFVRFTVERGRQKAKELTTLALFVLIGIIIFALEGLGNALIAQLTLGVLIFSGMLVNYGSRVSFVYAILGVIFVLLSLHLGYRLIAQSMLIGCLDEVAMLKAVKERRSNRKVEVSRDIIQLFFGVVFILLFYFVALNAAGMVMVLFILIGIILVNFSNIYERNPVSRIIYGLERKGTALGYGALWLAMGTLVALSFLNTSSIIIIFSAMFIGDSLATIFGVSLKTPKLPYNRSKSIGGTFAYFIGTSAVSFLVLLSPIALVVGLVAAFLESIPWQIDDNFTVSFLITAAILVGKALGL